MITSKCAFSACIVNNSIYTFGGYDGTKRLDTIDIYKIVSFIEISDFEEVRNVSSKFEKFSIVIFKFLI